MAEDRGPWPHNARSDGSGFKVTGDGRRWVWDLLQDDWVPVTSPTEAPKVRERPPPTTLPEETTPQAYPIPRTRGPR